MNARFIAVFLVFCGFAVTGAQAKPRTVPDRVMATEKGGFVLETLGKATLSGVLNPSGDSGLKVGEAVEVKALPKDRYGRTPVLLYKPNDKKAWQEHLLFQGLVMAYDRAATPKAWLKQEEAARIARRGLWNEAALNPSETASHMGEFRWVEGKVTRTYKSREMYYINFGEDWKTDFSLRIPRRAWRGFGKDFTIADGTTLRARGAIFSDNGPMIEITRPEQLEVLHANAQ